MGSKLISVIVPVYNAEKFLSDCIESILCQTYTNFELLLIDDGSIDGSLNLCNVFEKKDHRVKVFHHNNKGVCYTRNRGIEMSKGEYITFVDSDDLIMPEYLEKLLNGVALFDYSQSTISLCKFYKLNSKNNKVEYIENYDNLIKDKIEIESIIEDIIFGKIFGSSCRMLIPLALIESNSISFGDCRVREDQLFFIDILSNIEKIVLCDDFLYLYRDNLESVSSKFINDLIDDQNKYLSSFLKILSNLDIEINKQKELFGYAVMNVRFSCYKNAARSKDFNHEIKKMKTSEYYEYPVETQTEKKWIKRNGKTAEIVFELAKRKLYLLIYSFFKIKKLILHHY